MPGARRLIRWVSACVVLWTAGLALAADTTATPLLSGRPGKSTTAAVFMSMAVPGLGQFYTHCYIKAAAAVAIEGSLSASMSYNNDRMMAARRSAVNAGNNLVEARAHAGADTARFKNEIAFYGPYQRFFQNQRNRLIWWMAGTVLLSMGDAYVDAHLYGIDFSPNLSCIGGTVGVSVACKF